MNQNTANFQQHPFFPKLTEFKEFIDLQKTNNSNFSKNENYNKVLLFCDLIKSFYHSLIHIQEIYPVKILEDNVNSLNYIENCITNYNNSGDGNQLIYMNNEIANVMQRVNIYTINGKDAKISATKSYNALAEFYYNKLNEIRQKSELTKKIIEKIKDKSQLHHDEIIKYHKELLVDTNLLQADNDHESIKSKINQTASKIEEVFQKASTHSNEINSFYRNLLSDNEFDESIKTKILSAKTEIEKQKSEIDNLLNESQKEIDSLKNFYIKVIGDENNTGLESIIDERHKALDNYEDKQKSLFANMETQINSLLVGATNAGLAKSFNKMSTTFKYSIMFWNSAFIISLICLVAFNIFGLVANNLEIKFKAFDVDFSIYKMVFISLPIIWLAIFCQRRRAEFVRLQQEYAHKEAVAMSYLSYKEQIQNLNLPDTKLLENLMEKTINVISYNPSKTLDGKVKESMPTLEFLDKTWDKVSPEKILEILLEKIAKKN